MHYSEAAIKKLNNEAKLIPRQYQKILLQYGDYKFEKKQSYEYALQGFVRRVKLLARCVENVYGISPPERNNKLSADELSDLTISMQGFVFNAFGCLDNLAWLWVIEKDVRSEKGEEIRPSYIGLGPKNTTVRNSLPIELHDRLKSYDAWFRYLENFRHALAHRIPLYIPPAILVGKEMDRFKELETEKYKAISDGDFDKYDDLVAEGDNLGRPALLFTHSFSEKAENVMFHSQILNDWVTVLDISQAFLENLSSPPRVETSVENA